MTKDELLVEMRRCRREYDNLGYQLDFTSVSDEDKIVKKVKIKELRSEYEGYKKQRDDIIQRDFQNSLTK